MRRHRLIHDIKKLFLDLYFRFNFLSVNSINFCAYHLLSEYKYPYDWNAQKYDKILGRTRTALCKQKCKQRYFLANGADLIDRRETWLTNITWTFWNAWLYLWSYMYHLIFFSTLIILFLLLRNILDIYALYNMHVNVYKSIMIWLLICIKT